MASTFSGINTQGARNSNLGINGLPRSLSRDEELECIIGHGPRLDWYYIIRQQIPIYSQLQKVILVIYSLYCFGLDIVRVCPYTLHNHDEVWTYNRFDKVAIGYVRIYGSGNTQQTNQLLRVPNPCGSRADP